MQINYEPLEIMEEKKQNICNYLYLCNIIKYIYYIVAICFFVTFMYSAYHIRSYLIDISDDMSGFFQKFEKVLQDLDSWINKLEK